MNYWDGAKWSPSDATFHLSPQGDAFIADKVRHVTRLAGDINSVGAVITPVLGAAFILSGVEHTSSQLAAMTSEQLQTYRITEANMVRGPYLVITGLFLAALAVDFLTKKPCGL